MTEASKLLAETGAALFGYAWRVDMSEALGVDQRTIRKWLIGRDPIPRGVWLDILTIAATRRAEIDTATLTIAGALPEIAPR